MCFWSWNMKWKDPSGQFLYFNLTRAQMWISQNNGIRTILVEGKKWPSHPFRSSYWKELMNKWIIKESKLLIWLPLINNTQQCFWYAPEPYVRLFILSLTASKTGFTANSNIVLCIRWWALDYLWRQYLLPEDVFLIPFELCSEEHSSVISQFGRERVRKKRYKLVISGTHRDQRKAWIQCSTA